MATRTARDKDDLTSPCAADDHDPGGQSVIEVLVKPDDTIVPGVRDFAPAEPAFSRHEHLPSERRPEGPPPRPQPSPLQPSFTRIPSRSAKEESAACAPSPA